MKLQMDGPFPVLPDAPAEHFESAGELQLMIREFMSVHYRLACGKESTTPWSSMWKHQSTLWDSDMWPSDIIVRDPSKIVLNDCRSIVALWRQRQAKGASETFRFNFYINSNGLHPSKLSITTPLGDLRASRDITPAETVQRSPAERAMIQREGEIAVPPASPFHTPIPEDDTAGERGLPSVDPHSPLSPDVESDPPLGNRKKKRPAAVYSDEEGSSDPSSDNSEARSRRQRAVISQLALAPLSPQNSDQDVETLPPRYNKSKKSNNKRTSRKNAPPAANIQTDVAAGHTPNFRTITSGQSLANGGVAGARVNHDALAIGDEGNANLPLAVGGETSVERPRPKPKPKPRKKQAALIDGGTIPGETPAEQRDREDNLFIVRKSGRTHKPKYNIAPPAQLRLEKEREVNKRKGNHS